ncbi:MAG: N-acetyltransferase [Alphaproteobacteria bacterium]|nr:N-acetyltransferase [Alphaproteobacteria bacterium]
MSDEIRLERQGAKGRYVITAPTGEEAELTWTGSGDDLRILDHTGVPDVFRGQGIGLRLVTRAVEDARAGGFQLLPLCPFAAAQFDKHPEWADVRRR